MHLSLFSLCHFVAAALQMYTSIYIRTWQPGIEEREVNEEWGGLSYIPIGNKPAERPKASLCVSKDNESWQLRWPNKHCFREAVTKLSDAHEKLFSKRQVCFYGKCWRLGRKEVIYLCQSTTVGKCQECRSDSRLMLREVGGEVCS